MTDRPAPDPRPADAPEPDEVTHSDSLVRHEQELRVHTQRVRTGRVRLRKRVVEEEQTFTVTVRHEEADLIEEELDVDPGASDESGMDLDGPAESVDVTDSGGDPDAPGEDTVEVVLYAERPVVTMERVPVERVRLRRVRHLGEQTLTDNVLREDIVLDRDDPDPGATTG